MRYSPSFAFGGYMNAYELPKGQSIPTWSMSINEVKALIETNRQQADRIAELEKQSKFQADNKVNNKPVAWMDYLEHSNVYDLNVSGRGIPLYTHPSKTLTGAVGSLSDEEIVSLYKETEADNGGIREFARAILKKASEK
jgi:hypothetical protein